MLSNKKVLILSFYYPPSEEISAHRLAGFVKYLPKYNFQPLVVTSGIGDYKLDNFNDSKEQIFKISPTLPMLIRNFLAKAQKQKQEYLIKFYEKSGLITRLLIKISLFWNQVSWLFKAFILSKKLIKKHQIKIIFTSCGPFSNAIISTLLKKTLSLRSVVEFRDSWSSDPYLKARGIKHFFIKKLEKWILKNTDYFITTTPSTTNFYLNKYLFLKGKITTIYNGFDDTLFSRQPLPYSKFTLIYSGSLYAGRNIDSILNALALLPHEDVQFLIYGKIYHYLSEFEALIKKLNLEGKVFFKGQLPHEALIQELQKSHLLLLLQGFQLKENSCYPIAGKTFEYLRTGLPILCLAPEGDNTEIIRKYASEFRIFTSPPSVPEMQETLIYFYQQWKVKKIFPKNNTDFNKSFHLGALTKNLSEVFNKDH